MPFLEHLSPTQQFLLFSTLKIVAAIFLVLLPMVAYSVLAERKISAFIQDRVGPNRVGPFGIWQPLADGLKSFVKEDFTPAHVRKAYFWLAPALSLIPAFLTVAVIPFGSFLGKQQMVIADLNVGILYTFGIVSLGVYGIVLAGYAANSKYPFLGGIRSSAQMISYEIAMGMSVIPVFMIIGATGPGRCLRREGPPARRQSQALPRPRVRRAVWPKRGRSRPCVRRSFGEPARRRRTAGLRNLAPADSATIFSAPGGGSVKSPRPYAATDMGLILVSAPGTSQSRHSTRPGRHNRWREGACRVKVSRPHRQTTRDRKSVV